MKKIISILFTALLFTGGLSAVSLGETGKTYTKDGIEWHEVYYDGLRAKLTADMPGEALNKLVPGFGWQLFTIRGELNSEGELQVVTFEEETDSDEGPTVSLNQDVCLCHIGTYAPSIIPPLSLEECIQSYIQSYKAAGTDASVVPVEKESEDLLYVLEVQLLEPLEFGVNILKRLYYTEDSVYFVTYCGANRELATEFFNSIKIEVK